LYNKDGSVFFKSAQRIKKDSRNIMANLEKLRIHHDLPLCPPNGELSVSDVEQDRVTLDHTQEQGCAENEHPNLSLIGDLEPDFDSLELLVSSGPIREDLNIDLDNSAPIASLFSYEFAKVKPPPPESPLSNRGGSTAGSSRFGMSGRRGGKKGKQKRDRKAEIERARLNREAKDAAARAAASVGSESLTEGEDEALQTEISGRRKGKQRESEVQPTLNAWRPQCLQP
jgi:NuA3 HAT complex component NTO1